MYHVFLKKYNVVPKLSAILVGDDPASKIYVNSKHKTFLKFDCLSEVHRLPNDASEDSIFNLIKKLNSDRNIHGILL